MEITRELNGRYMDGVNLEAGKAFNRGSMSLELPMDRKKKLNWRMWREIIVGCWVRCAVDDRHLEHHVGSSIRVLYGISMRTPMVGEDTNNLTS